LYRVTNETSVWIPPPPPAWLSPFERRELAALDVDLQEVEMLNLGNVVEPASLQGDALDHFP
jgi:hypothetical protein